MLTPEKVLQESLKETQRVKLSELEDQRSAGETRKEEERSVSSIMHDRGNGE